MQTEHTVLLPDSRRMRVTLAVPDTEVPESGWPGVLVIHEIVGHTREITDIADLFADRGWAAVVPNLYSAGTKLGCLVRALREIRSGRAGTVTEDLRAVLEWLRSRNEVDGERTATIGFCLGGSFALLLGTLGPVGLRAVSDNYGMVTGEETDLTRCPPVVGSFGADDPLAGKVAPLLESELDAAGVIHDITSYPGAAHGFLTADHKIFGILPVPGKTFAYVESAATPAWRRIFAFLDEHVGT